MRHNWKRIGHNVDFWDIYKCIHCDEKIYSATIDEFMKMKKERKKCKGNKTHE